MAVEAAAPSMLPRRAEALAGREFEEGRFGAEAAAAALLTLAASVALSTRALWSAVGDAPSNASEASAWK